MRRTMSGAIVAILMATLWLPWVTPQAEAAPSTVRWGYYVYWHPSSLDSLRQHVGQLDIVSPYYYELHADGTIEDRSDAAATKVMRDAGVKIVPLIKNQSRWEKFHTTIETAEKRDEIVARLVTLVQQNDYDGIHIDFEAVKPYDQALLTDFMTRLYSALHPQGKLVTQAVISRTSDNSGEWNGAYDYAALAEVNDYIVIMAYDHSPIGGPAGPIAPVGWVSNVVDYSKTRIPAEKIILGMPLYGYDWILDSEKPATPLRYEDAIKLQSEPGATFGFDETYQTPWVKYSETGNSHEVWYEDADSLRAKLNIMLDSGVGGFGLWRLGQEDPKVWTEIGRIATPATRIPAFADTNDRRYFETTGHSLAYGFKTFWERNGGLPVFGYPLTEEFTEMNPDTLRDHTVQYFERQRFEYHPIHRGTVYEVQLGRLGVTDAEKRGLLGTIPFQPLPDGTQAGPGCAYFAETSHRVCGRFLTYWQSHGLDFGELGYSFRESLGLFGYPISEEYTDPATGLIFQYFERARFEYHPENAAPHDVLLGLLGTDAVREKGWIR